MSLIATTTKFTPSYFMVRVRFANNTYQTDTIGGQKASATSGSEQAALALGKKIFGTNRKISTIRMDGSGMLDWFEVHAAKPARGGP